ncbi:MAG: sugar phosphate nucleotidyltransferase [Candidatus Thorarchaeota archaeon]
MNMISKLNSYVIILAAGFGARLKPLSNRIPKPLIDINGQTLISRIISNFEEAGFKKFCVIVGYKKALIKNEIKKNNKVQIKVIKQKEPIGMADAIEIAFRKMTNILEKEKISTLFITAADIIFSKSDILKMYELYQNSKSDMILSLMRSKDKRIAEGHGNVKISEDSDLTKDIDINYGLLIGDVIEKPKIEQIFSEYYSLPLYLINTKMMKFLKSVNYSERGEKEFQDVIKNAISVGHNIRGIKIIDSLITIQTIGKYHLTNLKDIIKMNSRFLYGLKVDKFKGNTPKCIEPVKIHSSTIIGDNVTLGPNVIIGKKCEIGNSCVLSNALLYNNVCIRNSNKLNWCIIDEKIDLPENFKGRECFITRNKKNDLEIIKF